jgi:hypothetical protein
VTSTVWLLWILVAVLEIGAWYWRFGEERYTLQERFQMLSERFPSKAATGVLMVVWLFAFVLLPAAAGLSMLAGATGLLVDLF